MITTNAHEISLERGRLWIVLATIVINIVAVFRHLDAFYYLNDFASDFGPVWREGMLDRKLAWLIGEGDLQRVGCKPDVQERTNKQGFNRIAIIGTKRETVYRDVKKVNH